MYTCTVEVDYNSSDTHARFLSLRIREKGKKAMLHHPKKSLVFLSFSADPCHGSELMFHLLPSYEEREVDLRSRYSQE